MVDSAGPAQLPCAHCGGDFLHHGTVDVYVRPREDAPDGVHMNIQGMTVRLTNDLAGNPSARRDGLTVRFTCENCAGRSILTIAQHKGTTELGYGREP